MSKKAMNFALDVLKTLVDRFDYEQFTSVCELDDAKDVIKALEEALAKQEQCEPVGECIAKGVIRWNKSYPEVGTKLYTTPQQRTWVGLTDEEIRACITSNKYAFEIVRAAEAKLKEKNT